MEAVCSPMIISSGDAANVCKCLIILHFAVIPIGVCCHWEGYQTRPRGVISPALGPAAVHRCASLCIRGASAYCADFLSTTLQSHFSSFFEKSFSRSLSSHRPPPSTEEGIRGPEDDDRWGSSYEIRIKSLCASLCITSQTENFNKLHIFV